MCLSGAVPFYEKLGYKERHDMNPRTLEPIKDGEEEPAGAPRFVCVYMEKIAGNS